MIRKIILDNFMAHEHTELELGPGVNALTGPNNSGKSAIVEALRYLTSNPAPSSCIRHGAKEARVTVELEDGTRVTWVRTKRYPLYEILYPGQDEPEEFAKMGRGGVPDEVRDVLRLDFLDIETGKKVDIHIGNQREPVFLINQPGSHAAAFFAASTESAHLLAMQDRLKMRTRDAKRKERDLEADLSRVEADLDHFAPLPAIAVIVEAARELETTAKRLQTELPALDNVIQRQQSLNKRLDTGTATATVLKAVISPPEVSDISGLKSLMAHMSALESGVNKSVRTAQSLQPLKGTPDVEDTRSLATLCNQLQAGQLALDLACRRESASASLSAPPAPERIDHLSHIIDDLLLLRTRSVRMDRWSSVLQMLAEPPVVESDAPLSNMVAELTRLEAGRKGIEVSLRELYSKLQKLEERIDTRVHELGCCPTCGAEMTTASFLDRGCRHDA